MISNRRMPLIRPLVAGLLVALGSGVAWGQSASSVIDGAGMFSEDAIRKAKVELARIESVYRVPVTIETVTSLNGDSIDEAATRHARVAHGGIFVFIAEKEHKDEVLAKPQSFLRELGKTRLDEIRDAFTAEFRRGKIDNGLAEGVKAVEKVLAAVRPFANSAPTPAQIARNGGGFMPTTPITAGGSSAGDSALVLRQQVRLTLAGAKKAIEGAEAKASQSGWKMNIAVVDDGGHLIAFERMDGARPASVTTATTKAFSAATYRRATGTFGPSGSGPDVALDLSIQNASGGKVTTLPGGLPIVVDGQVIGAIGVGGGSGNQDEETAKAGLSAFLDGLKAPKPEEPKEKPKDAEVTPKSKDQEIEAAIGKPAEPATDPK